MTRKALCVFALVAALFLTGCQQQVSAPLTEAEQAAIRAEVTVAAKTLLAAGEALDLEAVERLSHDGPDFLFIMPDGKVLTFAEMKKVGEEMLASLSGQKMITQKERVIVLAPDAALYVWQGRNDLVQKDGVVMTADPYGATYLFRKIGGAWKFAYAHESALPYQPVKTGEVAAQKQREALRTYGVQKVMLSHCTGAQAYAELAAILPGRCSWPASGTVISFGAR